VSGKLRRDAIDTWLGRTLLPIRFAAAFFAAIGLAPSLLFVRRTGGNFCFGRRPPFAAAAICFFFTLFDEPLQLWRHW
jgi:hypothetical protein